MRPLFIHSKPLKVRLVATFLFLGVSLLAYGFAFVGPRNVAMFSLEWWRNVTMVSVLFLFPVWLWRLAGQQPNTELPDPTAWSGPNDIPSRKRIQNGFIAIGLTVYALAGVWFNRFMIPTKRNWVHLHDRAAIWFAISLGFIVLRLFLVIVDHFDGRNNERTYADIGEACLWIFWACQLASMATNFGSWQLVFIPRCRGA
jgi:hypothetical protein